LPALEGGSLFQEYQWWKRVAIMCPKVGQQRAESLRISRAGEMMEISFFVGCPIISGAVLSELHKKADNRHGRFLQRLFMLVVLMVLNLRILQDRRWRWM
jgi:hypothetical protein